MIRFLEAALPAVPIKNVIRLLWRLSGINLSGIRLRGIIIAHVILHR